VQWNQLVMAMLQLLNGLWNDDLHNKFHNHVGGHIQNGYNRCSCGAEVQIDKATTARQGQENVQLQ